MFRLESSQYSGEMPGIRWQGDKLCASQFGDSEFMAASEGIGRFSAETLLKIWNVYVDNKTFMFGNRRSGEPNWHHPVGVALVGLLEFGEKDADAVVTALMHDAGEDCPIFQGHRNLVGEFEQFSRYDMLRGRYGERAAKAICALTKPAKSSDMPPDAMQRYLRFVYNRVVNLYPEVRELAARVKIWDRIFNLRTEGNEGRLARNVVESWRYLIPIAECAGPIYVDALSAELNNHNDLLSPDQKALCVKRDFNLEPFPTQRY